MVRVHIISYAVHVRFDQKARENIEAAERLLPDEDGALDALSNAAASRAYYAAYLAVADRAQQMLLSFTSREFSYYRHDTLPDDAFIGGIFDDDHRDDLRWLRDLRIKADYYEDQVDIEEASQAITVARDILLVVLMEES